MSPISFSTGANTLVYPTITRTLTNATFSSTYETCEKCFQSQPAFSFCNVVGKSKVVWRGCAECWARMVEAMPSVVSMMQERDEVAALLDALAEAVGPHHEGLAHRARKAAEEARLKNAELILDTLAGG